MPFGLSATELATLVGGLFTLWLSGQAYLRAGAAEIRAKSAEERAIRAEASAELSKKQALELAIAGEVQIARVDLRSIESSLDAQLWSLHKVRIDADIAKASRALAFCDAEEQRIARYRESVSSSIHRLIDPVDPAVGTHGDLLLLRGKLNTMIKEIKEDSFHCDSSAKDNLAELALLLANEKAGRLSPSEA